MSPQMQNSRKKHFTDRAVQGTLVFHLIGNWLVFLFTVGVFFLFVEMVNGGPHDAFQAMLRRQALSLWVALLLLPIFIWDLVRLTHRFAGPMVRLRREMRNLAEGRAVAPIKFRQGDFWQDLATDFNRVIERVQASSREGCPRQPTPAERLPEESPDHAPLALAQS
jgi:hypothetical protein